MRDKKGRFSKSDDDNLRIVVGFPPIKKLIFYGLIIVLLMPWISIIAKLKILQKIFYYF